MAETTATTREEQEMGKAVKSEWINGNLVFQQAATGNVICTMNGATRTIDFPATNILSIGGVGVTATAAQLNSVSAAINVRNDTGGNLTAGTLVFINGYHAASDAPTVAVAGLDSQATLVLVEDIDNGENGLADGEAVIENVNTDGRAIGDYLFLDAAGAFTFVAPTGADNLLQVVGVVVTVGVAGSAFFFPGYTLVDRYGTSGIQNLAITEGKIADLAVTNAKISNATIEATKLANGAGLGALVAAGLGATANYANTTAGAQDLAAADPAARACICVVVVTEAFADGGDTQTTFTIGDESTADSIMDVGKLTDAALDSVWVFAGQVTATEKLVVTGVAKTGAGTGAISVTALLLPEA